VPLVLELMALGGVPLVAPAFRLPGLPAALQEDVHLKQREQGYDDATYVESVVVFTHIAACPYI
jgi:hypothetical protein